MIRAGLHRGLHSKVFRIARGMTRDPHVLKRGCPPGTPGIQMVFRVPAGGGAGDKTFCYILLPESGGESTGGEMVQREEGPREFHLPMQAILLHPPAHDRKFYRRKGLLSLRHHAVRPLAGQRLPAGTFRGQGSRPDRESCIIRWGRRTWAHREVSGFSAFFRENRRAHSQSGDQTGAESRNGSEGKWEAVRNGNRNVSDSSSRMQRTDPGPFLQGGTSRCHQEERPGS